MNTPAKDKSYGEMTHQVSKLPPAKVAANIAALNFDALKSKLQDLTHGLVWSERKVERVELMYRRFLFLQTTSPKTVVPTKDIDEFWHGHILDTQKYPVDCQKAFGFFLHHFPYFGMRGGDDAQKLQEAFERSRTLYENTFGETYTTNPTAVTVPATEAVSSNDGARCSSCG